jgi:lipoprotein-releasing system permease protein
VFAVAPEAPGYKGPEWYGIIVGCDLLNVRRSDGNFDRSFARGTDMALTLMPLSPSGNPLGEPPIRLPLRYADDVRTGIFEIDSMSVYVDFDMVQKQLAMDAQELTDGTMSRPRASQLLVGLQPGADMNAARDRIGDAWREFTQSHISELGDQDAQLLSGVQVYTWEDMQRDFIQAVEKEKVLVTILFSLISLVAVVLVVCIFYMIVEKKTKDIGILKALGASGGGVGGIFILYALAVGIIGSILGLTLGSAVVWNINTLQDVLASLNPNLRVWSPDIYSFDRIPETVKAWDATVIGVTAVVCTLFGSLIPAYIAARVWPVKALRYE